MTTIVNSVVSNFISSTNYGAITNGISFIVMGILLFLLIERVLIDAYRGKTDEQNLWGFSMVILPLILVMAVVIFLRMAQILRL